MAMSMVDKEAAHKDESEWPKALSQEFEGEAQNHNGCVGNALVSENERVRVQRERVASNGQRYRNPD